MKIAVLVCVFHPLKGGIARSAYDFCLAAKKRGQEITVFTPDYGLVAEELPFKVARWKPLLRFGYAAFSPRLVFALRGFDIIHLHYPFYGSGLLAVLAKIFSRGRTKLVVHYHMDTVASGLKRFFFVLERFFALPLILKFSNAITCASFDYIRTSYISSYYKKHQDKFFETSFSIDLEKFRPEEKRTVEETKTMLFVSVLDRAHYFKGLDVLFSALRRLKKDLPEKKWRLNIVGRGEREGYYRQLSVRYGLSGDVFFFNRVDDKELAEYYRRADFFVLPSIDRSEAFGLVLLEALASGTPVIASSLPGVREVFRDGQEGFLCPPGDCFALAEKIKIMLSLPAEKFAAMRRSARSRAEKKYSLSAVSERLIRAYKYAVGRV